MSKQDTAKPRLSREFIAETALAIADADGFEAVSMRRIAEASGAGTMSLYYYVKGKDDLVAAMDDALMGEVLLPVVPRPWRRAMMEIAQRTYAMYVRHPWSCAAMISAPPGRNAMRHMEQCLEALAETAMTAEAKIILLATIDDFVFGYALRTHAGAVVDRAFVRAQMDTGDFPRLKEAYLDAGAILSKDRLERGVNALLDAANLPVSASS